MYHEYNFVRSRYIVGRVALFKEGLNMDKVAKALSKFTDDINEHNPQPLEEYTKDLSARQRKEFIELAGFSLIVRKAFIRVQDED